MFDYLIVGSGLFGSVFAHEVALKGKKVKIIERRNHLGGNVYTEQTDNIQVHKYGAHIFHTSDLEVWNYINQFATFNRFTNSPISIYQNEVFNLPFNMNTFNKLWGVITPQEAIRKIDEQRSVMSKKIPTNLEEQAISLVGTDIYEKLIKEYTEKQWGRPCKELPPFIIKRLPVRFTYDNNYFTDTYQGIPLGGYTKMIQQLLDHPNISISLRTDFFSNKSLFQSQAKKIIYTGPIDQFYNYQFGHLEYRSLEFVHEKLSEENYQGNAVVNYGSKNIPYTRIIEHKHFEPVQSPATIITKEFPKEWTKGSEPYYPINDSRNTALFKKYASTAKTESNVIFGGRLGNYQYYDMDKTIRSALDTVRKEIHFSE